MSVPPTHLRLNAVHREGTVMQKRGSKKEEKTGGRSHATEALGKGGHGPVGVR